MIKTVADEFEVEDIQVGCPDPWNSKRLTPQPLL
jgi:hypothetical protein